MNITVEETAPVGVADGIACAPAPDTGAPVPFTPSTDECFCGADTAEPKGLLLGSEIREFRNCVAEPMGGVVDNKPSAGDLMVCSQLDGTPASLSGPEACMYAAMVTRHLLPEQNVVLCADVHCLPR